MLVDEVQQDGSIDKDVYKRQTRSFALRERGFSSTSSRVAMMGFFVRIRIFGLRPQTQTGNDGGQVLKGVYSR